MAYKQTIHQDRELTKEILWDLSEYSKECHIIRSNHTDRLYNTLLKVPGLISLPELQYPKFMGFAEMGMTYHKEAYEFEPGWMLAHIAFIAMGQHPAWLKLVGLAMVGHTHFGKAHKLWVLQLWQAN